MEVLQPKTLFTTKSTKDTKEGDGGRRPLFVTFVCFVVHTRGSSTMPRTTYKKKMLLLARGSCHEMLDQGKRHEPV